MYNLCVAVVQECKQRLLAAGFNELNDREAWSIKPSGKVRSRHSQLQFQFQIIVFSILLSTTSQPSLLLLLEPNLNQAMVLPWWEPTLTVLA